MAMLGGLTKSAEHPRTGFGGWLSAQGSGICRWVDFKRVPL